MMLINLSFSFLALGLVLTSYIIDYDNQYEGVPVLLCLIGFCIILSLFFYIAGGV